MYNSYLEWNIKKIEEKEFYEKHKYEIAKEELFSINNVCPICRNKPNINCNRCHGTGEYVNNEMRKYMFVKRD